MDNKTTLPPLGGIALKGYKFNDVSYVQMRQSKWKRDDTDIILPVSSIAELIAVLIEFSASKLEAKDLFTIEQALSEAIKGSEVSILELAEAYVKQKPNAALEANIRDIYGEN